MTAILLPNGKQQYFTTAGLPAVGYKLATFAAGTSTPQTTWQDALKVATNTNPIILDARGEASVFWDGVYKVQLQDSTGAVIWTQDNLQSQQSSFGTSLLPATTNSVDLGSVTLSWRNLYLGPNNVPALDTVSGSVAYFVRTAAETAATVTPTSFSHEYDLARYGADVTGATDSTAAINRAINAATAAGGRGIIWHPGGTIMHASQITVPNGITIQGWDRTACLFNYTGSAASSAWRNVNAINSSGFGRVTFRNIGITTAVATSTAAGIELNAGGFSFYEIDTCRVTGTFKYGVILDATEVSHVHHNIFDNGLTVANSANIWLVNGSDRSAGQTVGFTNSITINDNQINGAVNGIADDGGSNHYILNNNVNGNQLPIRIAGVQGFTIGGNEIENALAGAATGEANIDFLTLSLSGANVGACQAGGVRDNFLGADMAAGGCSLKFGGAAFHQGIFVSGNWFRNNGGRTADIDVTKLSNGLCAQNYTGGTGGAHYTGVHNDANGNTLWPPQNGSASGFAQNAYTWGDGRFRHYFTTGIRQTKVVVPYSASMTFDCRLGNIFQIVATNSTAFTINTPTGDPTNGDDGTIITIQIKNTSGGALGAITFGGLFKLSAAFVAPATGFSRSITFYDDNTAGAWYEISRNTTDVPN